MPGFKQPFFVAVILCGALLSGGWGFLIAADVQESATVRDAVAMDMHLDKQSQTVDVTDKGKKYHPQGCRYLKGSKRPVPLEEAKKIIHRVRSARHPSKDRAVCLSLNCLVYAGEHQKRLGNKVENNMTLQSSDLC